MSKRALTEIALQRIKLPAQGQVDVFDKGYPALALRVSCGGTKAFTFHYRLGGKLKRITLGTYPEMTLAEAREAWRDARRAVATGTDPIHARRRRAPAMGFEGVIAEWLKRDQGKNKRLTVYQVERMIERDLMPAWRGRHVDEITKRDVLDLLDSIIDRGSPIKARRTFAAMSRFFKWCVEREILTRTPMLGLTRPGTEESRERVLSDAELTAIWHAAGTQQVYGAIVRLLALTGARREEIGQLKWSELDDNLTTITLEGSRTKTGKPHLIPISAPARELLARQPRIAGCDYVFATDGKRPVAGWSRVKKLLDEASGVGNWRVHDLRRTLATRLQGLGASLQVIEAVLAHTGGSRGGIVGVYQRHEFDREKRAALEMWGRYVTALLNEPVWTAVSAHLAEGDHEAQEQARKAFNRAIGEGNGAWAAYVDSVVNPATNVRALKR